MLPDGWILVVGSAGLLFMGAGAGYRLARWLWRPFTSARNCAEAAHFYMSTKDYGRALRWIGHARALDPADPKLVLAEAEALLQLGETTGAFRILDELHGGSGASALEVALLLKRLEMPSVHVVAWLREAFELDPPLAARVSEETHREIAAELRHLKTTIENPSA